jgi:hypothetical protein
LGFAEEQSHFRHENTTIRQVHAIVSGTVQNNRQTASKHVPDRRSSVKRNKRGVQHDQLEILPPTRRINPQEVPAALFQSTSIVLSAPTLRGAPTIRAHPPFWRIHHSGASTIATLNKVPSTYYAMSYAASTKQRKTGGECDERGIYKFYFIPIAESIHLQFSKFRFVLTTSKLFLCNL